MAPDYDIKVSASAYHPNTRTASVQVIERGEQYYSVLKSFRFSKADPLSKKAAMDKADKYIEKLNQQSV